MSGFCFDSSQVISSTSSQRRPTAVRASTCQRTSIQRPASTNDHATGAVSHLPHVHPNLVQGPLAVSWVSWVSWAVSWNESRGPLRALRGMDANLTEGRAGGGTDGGSQTARTPAMSAHCPITCWLKHVFDQGRAHLLNARWLSVLDLLSDDGMAHVRDRSEYELQRLTIDCRLW